MRKIDITNCRYDLVKSGSEEGAINIIKRSIDDLTRYDASLVLLQTAIEDLNIE